MYKVKHIRPQHFDYDLIVIGSGAGGGVAANLSARIGKKVAVIEAGKVGGECPNYGCTPTKALLTAAEAYTGAKEASRFGIRTHNLNFDYASVKAWKDKAVYNTGTHDGAQAFTRAGIELIKGHAHFLNKWTVSIGHKRLTARKFLIASGTYNLIPPIEGLKQTGYITYREAIELERPPKSLLIIGGGAIGVEFGEIFNTFGTRTVVAELAPRLLVKEDQEAGMLLERTMTEKGIEVHTGTKVIKVTGKPGRKEATLEKEGKISKIIVEEILLATGKAAMTDIGLENAGVAYERGGIIVDQYMQTTAKHIYAAGDVVGPYMFTHMASYQSRIAGHNMWRRSRVRAKYHAVPRCVFTSPEIASAGYTETELIQKKIDYQRAAIPISIIGRSNTSGQDTGFVKVLASYSGVLLGATIVAPRAGEMIHELTLAIHKGLRASDIDETIHAFPTWSEAVRIACSKIICT
ncbi:NAD(P)/FAD-dependent oxidoreductase [Candidatus Saccharibacteria bacterium]|nr:NAD(P)/FAD-dependent oxidoreductase [Candidatus Saccharibacteria bacterium]MCB9821029.1 NAD(P)/FAD-dependent oxidoreductase [Candidatus Nomurabacteria bacterium]